MSSRLTTLPWRSQLLVLRNSRASVTNLSSWRLVGRGTPTGGDVATIGLADIDAPLSSSCPASVSPLHRPLFQQVRWRRKDGYRFYAQERPPTKKQRKRYNREKQAEQAQVDKHSRPGSKAGPRRQYLEEWQQEIRRPPPPPPTQEELDAYGLDDALLDDLVGNTKDALDTPFPASLGHRQQELFNIVADQMEEYQRQIDAMRDGGATTNGDLVDIASLTPPSDHDVSRAVRAFRDRYGTRQKPVGLARALHHLFQDMSVPLTGVGELTGNALLSCCATPAEGRRVLKLFREHRPGHEISGYSWSILVDLYAKVGDYKGCLAVHKEMATVGCAPTLASYTSLLAACHKVCVDGRLANKVRSQAAAVAWEQWKEMRIVGISADAMAYGAMLRILAAKGQPERALSLLEEMQSMEVAPTTLCYTSALKAVAKSHEVAHRFERGSSRRHLRREFLAAHHGKLARKIVLLAETAGVEQDKGFVAALILCAAAAGDVATAKAIYVADGIRRLSHLRTIGSDEHLARLRGEDPQQKPFLPLVTSPEENQLVDHDGGDNSWLAQPQASEKEKWEEREYGRDSRVLTAILRACANSCAKNGIGTMWQGRENSGMLCENSLRLLRAPRLPQYDDDSIPGATRTDHLEDTRDLRDEGYRASKRLSGRIVGVVEDDDTAVTLDELSDTFAKIYLDEDGRRKPEYQKLSFDDVWKIKYGNKSASRNQVMQAQGFITDNSDPQTPMEAIELVSLPEEAIESGEGKANIYFSYDTMRWETRGDEISAEVENQSGTFGFRSQPTDEQAVENMEGESELYFSYDTMKWETRAKHSLSEHEEELYFSYDTMKWETRPRKSQLVNQSISKVEGAMMEEHMDETRPVEFFFDQKEMRWESRKGVKNRTVFEEKRLESWKDASPQKLEQKEKVVGLGGDLDDRTNSSNTTVTDSRLVERSDYSALGDTEHSSNPSAGSQAGDFNASFSSRPLEQVVEVLDPSLFAEQNHFSDADFDSSPISVLESATESDASVGEVTPADLDWSDRDLEELRTLLPMFSQKRLRKILNVFRKELGTPSLMDLVSVVRETMPDFVTNTWLKKMSSLTAAYVHIEAEKDGLIDGPFLTSMVGLKASLGSLDEALKHYHEFERNKIIPNEYTDRLVVQMFLQHNRFSRAMSFKASLQKSSRTLDLASYGSLVDFCSRRQQFGSALLLIRECVAIHGHPPNEAMLAHFRTLCKHADMSDDPDIVELIGTDPLRWLKHGEAELKREYSKKGRRDVRLPRDIMLRA